MRPRASADIARILDESRPFPLLGPNEDLPIRDREFNSFFTHGYIISSRPFESPSAGAWRLLKIGSFTGYIEGQTRVGRAAGPNGDEVVLLGHPLDLSLGEVEVNKIARAVVSKISTSGVLTTAIDYVSRLGGRFTCLIWAQHTLTVVPDCHATQPVYLYAENGWGSFASHAALLVELWGLQTDPEAKRCLEARRAINPRGTVHLPGLVTPYVGIRPLIANCLAKLDLEGNIAHERFYPSSGIEEAASFEIAYEEFEELFVEHMRLLCRLGVIGVALTSGFDSRATLAVAQHLARYGLFAYTFFGFNRVNKEEIADVTGANKAAFESRVPHLIVRWDLDDNDTRFSRMYGITWPKYGQARGIARAYYEGLPAGFVGLMSTGAETGSVFYKNRVADITTSRVMSGVYVGRPDDEGVLSSVFAEYIEWTDFANGSRFGIDPYDLFYWEHRNSRWLATRYQEMDLSHRVIVPFNQRGIIEAMLKAPLEVRQTNAFQKRLIERFSRLAS